MIPQEFGSMLYLQELWQCLQTKKENDMKLRCSAGHEYDTENTAHRWWKGERKEGDKCPEVLSYDVMARPKTKRCNRTLKRVTENDKSEK